MVRASDSSQGIPGRARSRETMTAPSVSGKNRPQCDPLKIARMRALRRAASCMGPESRPTKPADRAIIPKGG